MFVGLRDDERGPGRAEEDEADGLTGGLLAEERDAEEREEEVAEERAEERAEDREEDLEALEEEGFAEEWEGSLVYPIVCWLLWLALA